MKKPKNSIADIVKKAEELHKSLIELQKATNALFEVKSEK